MQNLHSELKWEFPDLEFHEEYPLARHTTVKIGGPAEVFFEAKTSDDFVKLSTYAIKKNIPLTILGWGANTLISDAGIRGLVIKNSAQEIKILDEKDQSIETIQVEEIEHRWQSDKTKGSFKYEFADLDYDETSKPRVVVEIDSGVSLPFAINTLINQGITGLQWYSRIPATLGGAIYNNIHGGTHFISEVIQSVKVIDEYGDVSDLNKIELKAGYDISRFHDSKEIIVSAKLNLYKGDSDKAKQVSREWAVRKAIQPAKSLGCVFQNISNEEKDKLGYPTTSVGYIVDHVLHKKSFQIGDARVSNKHAAFIENVGESTATDYIEVIKTIIKETKEKTNIRLKPEIFFLGFSEEELKGVTH